MVSNLQPGKKLTLIRRDIFDGDTIHFIHEVFHRPHESLVEFTVRDQGAGIGLAVETLHQFQGVFGFPYDGTDGDIPGRFCQPEATIPAPDTLDESPLTQLMNTFDKMSF